LVTNSKSGKAYICPHAYTQLKNDIGGLLETMDEAEDKISLSDRHDDAEEKSWMDEEQDKSMKDEAAMVEDQEDTIGDDLDKIENDEADSKE
jgi:hypothetical protein